MSIGRYQQYLEGVKLPRMFWARQCFPNDHIAREEIAPQLTTQLSAGNIASRVRPGMRIAITAGSRGVDNIDEIIRTIVSFVRSRGAQPFIIPAMGSHGGASAEGQREILAGYNITERTMGCPIVSEMDVRKIGVNEDGAAVYIDKNAAEADGIIVCGRVKPHTCFRGAYESGLMKMMAIGLGKQYGASVCHDEGFGRMAHNVLAFGKAIVKNAPVLFAVATIENAYDQTCRLETVASEEIEAREPQLLEFARGQMPKIYPESCDLLVVDEIGKNYSGDGMDPNITGTFCTPYASGGVQAQTVAVLDLSEQTHGNAIGIGMAHITTDRVFRKAVQDMYMPNCITCKVLTGGRMPMHVPSDREAMEICLKVCAGNDSENPRVIRIANSLHIGCIQLSENYLPFVRAHPQMQALTEPCELRFDSEGNLLDLGWEHPAVN